MHQTVGGRAPPVCAGEAYIAASGSLTWTGTGQLFGNVAVSRHVTGDFLVRKTFVAFSKDISLGSECAAHAHL